MNRVLFPYMNESLVLLQEGVSMEAIDRAATKFGMPMGPITLTDLVGLETAVYAGKVVAEAYPDRTVTSPILEEMLKASGGDKKSLLRFWLAKGKKAKPEPNPAVAGDHRQAPDRRPRRWTRRRSPTGSSCRCCWRRPGSWRKGSSASRATSTWA